MAKLMRLDRFLAEMGVGSRSEVKNYIKKGRIKINKEITKDANFKVDLNKDKVYYDNQVINFVEYEYFMLNKPVGVISASEDKKQKTVIDLIEDKLRDDLFPVGRLDKDTEGLLLITNDGELAHKLLSPKKHVIKTYFAKVLGKVNDEHVELFKKGLYVDDTLTAMPAELQILDYLQNISNDSSCYSEELDSSMNSTITEIYISIKEGKFHQIKRMFEAVGMKVIYLKRISMGELELDNKLETGEYRRLTDKEINLLKNS